MAISLKIPEKEAGRENRRHSRTGISVAVCSLPPWVSGPQWLSGLLYSGFPLLSRLGMQRLSGHIPGPGVVGDKHSGQQNEPIQAKLKYKGRFVGRSFQASSLDPRNEAMQTRRQNGGGRKKEKMYTDEGWSWIPSTHVRHHNCV